MKKNGFTLVELLATIIILAVVSLITVPIINNSIESSKRESFEVGISHLIVALQNDQATYNFKTRSYTFPLSASSTLKMDGDISDWEGTASIDEEGKIELAIYSNGYCASKEKTDFNTEISKKDRSECLN